MTNEQREQINARLARHYAQADEILHDLQFPDERRGNLFLRHRAAILRGDAKRTAQMVAEMEEGA
jgi:hypothetical protein